MKYLYTAYLSLIVASKASFAAVLPLNFGNQDLQTQLDDNDYMRFGQILSPSPETGNLPVYAQVRVANGNYAPSGEKPDGIESGSVNDDIRINLIQNRTITFEFGLFSEPSYSTPFAPVDGSNMPISYSFTLFFYDVDGHDTLNDNNRNYYDEISVSTESTYFTSDNSLLRLSNTSGGTALTNPGTTGAALGQNQTVFASGIGAGSVDGEEGLPNFITNAQANASIGFTFEDTPAVEFTYQNVWTGSGNRSRNLLIDGSSLTTNFTIVPEPSTFLGAGLGIFLMALRQLRRENFRKNVA